MMLMEIIGDGAIAFLGMERGDRFLGMGGRDRYAFYVFIFLKSERSLLGWGDAIALFRV
mgnify:CR=1 FL=1